MSGLTRHIPVAVLAGAVAVLAVSAAVVRPAVVAAQARGACGPNPSPPNAADPAVRATAPAAGARAGSPLRVSGQARVFEAVVSLELKDAAGRTIARSSTQAAAGAPVLAPFSATLPFTVTRESPACLWVFEASARDGSPRNVVQVPLTLLPPAPAQPPAPARTPAPARPPALPRTGTGVTADPDRFDHTGSSGLAFAIAIAGTAIGALGLRGAAPRKVRRVPGRNRPLPHPPSMRNAERGMRRGAERTGSAFRVQDGGRGIRSAPAPWPVGR